MFQLVRFLAEIFFSYTLVQQHSGGSPLLNYVKHNSAILLLSKAAVKLQFSQDSKMFSNTDTTVSRIVLTVQMFKILYLKCASPDEITSGVHLVALNCRQALFRGRPLPS